jgi:hypothetical protein
MPINYKKYPPNWKTEIVPAVLARANNCCENCGLENKQFVYSTEVSDFDFMSGQSGYITRWTKDPLSESSKRVKIVLTVAHLDHDEHNHDVSLDRLKALCQLCHLRYDAAEKKRRKLNKQQ